MKQNTNKERKSLKEVIAENKGKIIAGTVVITISGISYVLYKHAKAIKSLSNFTFETAKMAKEQEDFDCVVTESIGEMVAQINVAKDIAKEGALEEAIESVKRKIQYRVGKIEGCMKHNTPEALLQKELYEKELEILKKKLTIFEKEWDNMLH
jgi:hypothetical protein